MMKIFSILFLSYIGLGLHLRPWSHEGQSQQYWNEKGGVIDLRDDMCSSMKATFPNSCILCISQ